MKHNLLPRITLEKRKGIKKLLEHCIDRYKNTSSPTARRMWYDSKEFLAELQKEQFYTEKQAEKFNAIREVYYQTKKLRDE